MIARWLSAALVILLAFAPAISYADDCCSVDGLQPAAPLTGTELFPVFQSAPPLSQANANALSGFVISNLSRLTPAGVQFARTTAGSLPTCNSTTEGSVRGVVDSTSNVAGASISGGGAFHVSAYCDGSGWKVWSGSSPTTPGYYFDAVAGNDANNCQSPATACQTIAHLNALSLPAGANVFFKGGQSFSGAIVLLPANAPGPITVSTYGVGAPTISSGVAACFTATNIPSVTVNGLTCTGSGNLSNGTNGIWVVNSQAGNTSLAGPTIKNNTVSGYGLIGIAVQGTNGQSGFAGITISNNTVHDVSGNGASSTESLPCIKVSSLAVQGGTFVHSNVTITGNTAYNCTGTAANTIIHTGDGILVRETNGATMSHNVVHDFGMNNGYVSGSAVGIWTNDAKNVTMSFNEVYHAFSQGIDGDGLDCDAGVINCTIEYNFSHDNQGAGILAFSGFANGVNDNINTTIRYNITQNNASVFGAEIYIAANAGTMSGLVVHNNTTYSARADGSNPLVESGSITPSGYVANNIFMINGGFSLVNWQNTGSVTFAGNDYYPVAGAFKVRWGGTVYTSFASWQAATGQEKISGVNVGFTSNPKIYVPGGGFIGSGSGYDPGLLMAYNLQAGSPMRGAGLDLNTQFGINPGAQDFYGNSILASGGSYPIGAAAADFGTFTASCTQSSNYLARVSSFSKLAQVNYNSLICGMQSDGDLSQLDGFYALGAPNSAAAALNLVSTNYTLTAHGTLTFTANNGYTGDGSSGYFDTGFNPSSAGGNFSINSALIGDYDLSSNAPAAEEDSIGAADGSSYSVISPSGPSSLCSGHSFGAINESTSPGGGVCNNSGPTNGLGLHEMIRTGSGAETLYVDTLTASGTTASNTVPNQNLYIIARNSSGSPSKFQADQFMAAWFGGGGVSPANVARRVSSFATALGINVY